MTIAGYGDLYESTHELLGVDENPITVIAIGAGSGREIAALEIDNTRNMKDSFVKVYGVTGAPPVPSVGITVPFWVFRVRGGSRFGWFFRSTGQGYTMDPLYIACVTTKGVSGNEGPENPVDVIIKADDIS